MRKSLARASYVYVWALAALPFLHNLNFGVWRRGQSSAGWSSSAMSSTRLSISLRLSLIPRLRMASAILSRVSVPLSGAKRMPHAAPTAAPPKNAAKMLSPFIVKMFKVLMDKVIRTHIKRACCGFRGRPVALVRKNSGRSYYFFSLRTSLSRFFQKKIINWKPSLTFLFMDTYQKRDRHFPFSGCAVSVSPVYAFRIEIHIPQGSSVPSPVLVLVEKRHGWENFAQCFGSSFHVHMAGARQISWGR